MDAAVAHLVALGHRRIGYLSPSRYSLTVRDRSDAFRRARAAHGLPDEDDLLQASGGGIDPGHGETAMALLLERSPDLTAVVCYNDTFAMGAVRHLTAVGRPVPAAVSVIGFDDTSLGYGFTPALTSVSAPRVEMGRESVRFLLALEMREDNKSTDEVRAEDAGPETRLFPVTLVVRDSTAPPPR
jgi:DNA-binding LacI/PurR family transcriptional regulator